MSTNEFDLRGKRALVTGASRGIGRAIALGLARHGASIAVHYASRESQAREVAEQAAGFGVKAVTVGGDLGELAASGRIFEGASAALGGIDILVNVAGGFRWEKFEDGDVETWDQLYAMNLRTAVVSCRAALPALLEHPTGRIVNIGAGAAASKAKAGMGAYTASKAGVQRLTEALSEEFKDRGITVNAILPGTIDTPRNRLDMPDADFSRWVTPAAIAEVIAFLASDAGSAVTGAAIPVFGRG